MVWNDTQWATFMDDSIKNTRKGLYEQMNFLGIADWAIDLLEGNTTSTAGPITTAPTTTTTPTEPYSYTLTDSNGDVLACQDEIVIQLLGNIPRTRCIGSISMISTAPPTSTTRTTSISVASTTPTPDGFGIMVFSDTNCQDYVAGYTWESSVTAYHAGVDIYSFSITEESDACQSPADALYEVWYISTTENECRHPDSLAF